MSGLFTLLFGAAVAASGIKHASDNAWCKQNLRKTLPNGIPYYTDADGKDRLMDGSQIIWYGFGDLEKVVKLPHHEVIYDARAVVETNSKNGVQILNEKFKNSPLIIMEDPSVFKDKDISYRYRPFERSTGRRLYNVQCINKRDKETGENYQEFRKYYDSFYYNLKDNKGVLISEEEYDNIYNTYKAIRAEISEKKYDIKDFTFWNY